MILLVKENKMIYEYDAFIEVPEKLGEDKMAELDCAIANFVEERFGFPVEFSILGQIDETTRESDLERVVRCKDCKYLAEDSTCIGGLGGYGQVVMFDDYCSYGERKEKWQKE